MAFGTRIEELTAALNRLAVVIERQAGGLGVAENSRYTTPPESLGLVDEKTMAAVLNTSHRTLGKHRRDGRLPGCSLRNGGRILWRVEETVAAWRKGIA